MTILLGSRKEKTSLFYDLPKPWYNEATKIVKPGFEISFDHKFTTCKDPFLYSLPIESKKRDWANFLGNEELNVLMSEEQAVKGKTTEATN